MTKNWQVNVNGNIYDIKFKGDMFSSDNKLYINNVENKIKSLNKFFTLIDYEFEIENEKFNLVSVCNYCDLAQNQYFLDDKTSYSPLNFPKMLNKVIVLFIISNALAFGIVGVSISMLISFQLIKLVVLKNNKKILPIITFISTILIIISIIMFTLKTFI